MKKVLFVLMLGGAFVGYFFLSGEKNYTLNKDAFRRGEEHFYTDASDRPISGKVTSENNNYVVVRTLKNGRYDGRTEVFIDGNLRWVFDFQNGKLHGKVIGYYENGVKKGEDDMVNGEMEGKTIFYNQDGSVYSMATVENGRVTEGYYIQDGRQIHYTDAQKKELYDINKKRLTIK